MGVPVAQSMFAGASLITTYLLSNQSPTVKSLVSPVTLDAAARYILVTVLTFLQSLADGKVSQSSILAVKCLFVIY